MARRELLSPEVVEQALIGLPGWKVQDGRLRWERRFHDFSQAFGFMTRVALAAEKLDHHPDWRNVWATVSIELWTHDAGGLTANDLHLAAKISEIAEAV